MYWGRRVAVVVCLSRTTFKLSFFESHPRSANTRKKKILLREEIYRLLVYLAVFSGEKKVELRKVFKCMYVCFRCESQDMTTLQSSPIFVNARAVGHEINEEDFISSWKHMTDSNYDGCCVCVSMATWVCLISFRRSKTLPNVAFCVWIPATFVFVFLRSIFPENSQKRFPTAPRWCFSRCKNSFLVAYFRGVFPLV